MVEKESSGRRNKKNKSVIANQNSKVLYNIRLRASEYHGRLDNELFRLRTECERQKLEVAEMFESIYDRVSRKYTYYSNYIDQQLGSITQILEQEKDKLQESISLVDYHLERNQDSPTKFVNQSQFKCGLKVKLSDIPAYIALPMICDQEDLLQTVSNLMDAYIIKKEVKIDEGLFKQQNTEFQKLIEEFDASSDLSVLKENINRSNITPAANSISKSLFSKLEYCKQPTGIKLPISKLVKTPLRANSPRGLKDLSQNMQFDLPSVAPKERETRQYQTKEKLAEQIEVDWGGMDLELECGETMEEIVPRNKSKIEEREEEEE